MSKDKADAAQKGGEIQKSEGGMPSLAPAELQGMVEIEVSVTAEDIKFGARCDCSSCPVARALNRWLKRGVRCRVFYALGIDFLEGVTKIAEIEATPRAARAFIAQFDSHRTGQPFSFMLSVPAKVLKRNLRRIVA